MLAYDLYLRNKNSSPNVIRPQEKPIKKIYVVHDTISIDSKTLDQYGYKISDRYAFSAE
jgi:hypothetical protein